MIYCLSILEYKELVQVKYFSQKKGADFEYIHEVFNSCYYWDNQVVAINYFLSLILEGIQKKRKVDLQILDLIYEIRDNANFQIQEFDLEFIENLYNVQYNSHVEIEDLLIEVQNSL